MTGVKGSGGPLPKRSEQRRRANKPAAGDPTKAPSGRASKRPSVSAKWHPIAKRWFISLAESGQSAFYQESDWASAYLLAESMSRELKPQPIVVGTGEHATVQMHEMPPKAASLAAWLKGMTALLATEGDRRRAALELELPKPSEGSGEEAASVSSIDAWRSRVDGTG